jgi:hypothetical protein
MIGCTRCGDWHKDAETAEGQKMSCTEVKEHWARLKKLHYQRYGHYPSIHKNNEGSWICAQCKLTIE